jgi:mersacidin/lichenicidin family type 2 lantibiotic
MSELDIIRAWKDKTYRNSLSADQLAQLPEHPAGAIELTNDEWAVRAPVRSDDRCVGPEYAGRKVGELGP